MIYGCIENNLKQKCYKFFKQTSKLYTYCYKLLQLISKLIGNQQNKLILAKNIFLKIDTILPCWVNFTS